MIQAVLQDGYIMAQEYLPAITEGDTRLFMLNGDVMEYGGAIAALQRLRSGGDLRTNLSVGGKGVVADVTEETIHAARQFGPRLKADGMFFVGLDVVGDKVLEVNVFSPGALIGASQLAGINFVEAVVKSLERKVAHKKSHANVSNIELATI
jgi:glutathione synthase